MKKINETPIFLSVFRECTKTKEGKAIFTYFVFSDYIHHTMRLAKYEQLEDNSITGTISPCKGLIAFGVSKENCQERLQSALESWILLRLKLGHSLPEIHGINMNKEPEHVQEIYSM